MFPTAGVTDEDVMVLMPDEFGPPLALFESPGS